MAENRSMSKGVILFALIACHALLSAEGRQLKYKLKESSTKEESERETAKQGSNRVNLHKNVACRKEDYKRTEPRVHIPSAENIVDGEKEILPPISLDDSAAVSKDNFRPTTPGNSPGVGHKHAEVEESKELGGHSLNAGHSVSGFKDDFRPTEPGHSPGVGHVLSNKSAQPKA